MSTQTTIDWLRAELGEAAPEQAQLTMHPVQTFSEPEDVTGALQAMALQQGWSQYTDRVDVLHTQDGQWQPRAGTLLNGEWVTREGDTVHLRFGQGQWVLSRCTLGRGDSVLTRSQRYLATEQAGSASALCYTHVYRQSSDQWQWATSLFTGFDYAEQEG